MTNDLKSRLEQHLDGREKSKTFTAKYNCNQLIYFEVFQYVTEAIAREKQIKKWRRSKKEFLINTKNPKWNSLNMEFLYVEED